MEHRRREGARAYIARYGPIAGGLGLCAIVLMHGLSHPYIAPWDEIVHANVSRNLATACCVPILHMADLGSAGRPSFTNTYVWLHKPLLPFYLRAAVHGVFGGSLLAFRLPSAFGVLLTAIALFAIARRFVRGWIATIIGLLCASNSVLVELAHGRMFSDLTDVMHVGFLTVVLGLATGVASGRPLMFVERAGAADYIGAALAAGVSSALAYACKGGLALPGLGVFVITLLWLRGRQALAPVFVTMLAFLALTAPHELYLYTRFPVEFAREQRLQIEHLTRAVGEFGRPWHFYLTVYWRDVFGLPLGMVAYAAMAVTLLRAFRHRRHGVLVLWIAGYVLPLSAGVTKIENFLLPVLPAVLLLVGACTEALLQSDCRRIVYQTLGIVALLVGLDYASGWPEEIRASLPAAGAAAILLAAWAAAVTGRVTSVRTAAAPRAAAAIMLCGAAVVVESCRHNWYMGGALPPYYDAQMSLKAAAKRIEGRLPNGAVVLVDETRVENAHLYVQYWARVNTLPASDLAFARRTLSNRRALYLLAESAPEPSTIVEDLPYGHLYRLN